MVAEEAVDLAAYARFLPSEPTFLESHVPSDELEPESERGDAPRAATQEEADYQACLARIEAAREQPALPGAPQLEARRARVLLRAKAEPVLFVGEPAFVGEVSPGMAARRKHLLTTPYQRTAVLETLQRFSKMRPELRQLLLRDGYFYSDDPAAARELTTKVGFEDLFDAPELVLERGSVTSDLVRREGVYVYASGPFMGTRARLLLFDRVHEKGQAHGPSLHVDVRDLARREGFDAAVIDQMSEDAIVVELAYEDAWVPALLRREGTSLSLDCLLISPERAAAVGRKRDLAYRRSLVVHALQRAITEQVRAGLPFDEPRTERGQQDGKLRERWERAYFGGEESYTFNGDRYSVYDDGGQPLTPQVCIDFVTETFERASGMHFAPRGEPPEKLRGALDFDEILGGRRRQELALREFARGNPKRLELLDFPVAERVPYEKVEAFFTEIVQRRADMRPGDIVIIRGRAAWDRYAEVHTHTFFVYEADPISGVPLLIAGNSGKPRILTWDDEMLRAPKRSIAHRVRPNMDWLYDHVVHRQPLFGERWAQPLVVSSDKPRLPTNGAPPVGSPAPNE